MKAEKQQTAVEWLVNKILTKDEMYDDYGNVIGYKLINSFTSSKDFSDYVDQAKSMEKEQSECICVNVIEMILDESEQGKEINSKEIFEKCYKETFKSE